MKLNIYRDGAGEWRWRVFARNGKLVACSGEGYRRVGSCRRIAVKLFPGFKRG